jgi:hypothetical protein
MNNKSNNFVKTKRRKEIEKQHNLYLNLLLFLTSKRAIRRGLNRTPFIYNGDDDDFLIVSKRFSRVQEIPISSNKGETV